MAFHGSKHQLHTCNTHMHVSIALQLIKTNKHMSYLLHRSAISADVMINLVFLHQHIVKPFVSMQMHLSLQSCGPSSTRWCTFVPVYERVCMCAVRRDNPLFWRCMFDPPNIISLFFRLLLVDFMQNAADVRRSVAPRGQACNTF